MQETASLKTAKAVVITVEQAAKTVTQEHVTNVPNDNSMSLRKFSILKRKEAIRFHILK